jgi:predicted transcriptional regulator
MSDDLPELGELEREVMQLVWLHAPITAEMVRERLNRPLKESTVRTVLRRLGEKGFVTHSIEGRTYVFRAVDDRRSVAAKAVRRVADWFCNGSIEEVLMGIVDSKMLDKEQLDILARRIEEAKRKGRK